MGFSGNLTAIRKCSALNRNDGHQDHGWECATGSWRENAEKGQPHWLPFHPSACCLGSNLLRRCARIRIAHIVKVPARRILLSLTGARVKGNQQ